MVSAYDIAFSFVEKAVNGNMYMENDIEAFFDRCVKIVNVMLDNGATSESILKNINKMKFSNITKSTNIYNLIGSNVKDNVLKSGKFYYHNLLRVLPNPPQTTWDINTGKIVTVIEPLFLEMRASITLSQITEYYCKCFEIKLDNSSISRYNGSVKYMIDKVGIDIVLFMIDAASDIILTEGLHKPASPDGVGEYEQLARERYFAKLSENKVSGDDNIVTRRRVLPYRSRGTSTTGIFYEEYDNYS